MYNGTYSDLIGLLVDKPMRSLMSDDNSGKSQDNKNNDEAARAAREQELRNLIQQVELEQAGKLRPQKESPHEFIERRMREKLKK